MMRPPTTLFTMTPTAWGVTLKNTSGATVVELVRHALLDGRVGPDVDVVAKLVVDEVGRQVRHTPLAEGTREHVAGAAAITLGLWQCFSVVVTDPM